MKSRRVRSPIRAIASPLPYVVVVSTALIASAAASTKDKLPVSLGEYSISLAGERIGQEQFRVFKEKRYKIESTRTIYFPEPVRYQYLYEMERSLEPRKLELTVTRSGVVTELELKRSGKRWRLEIDGDARDKRRHELGSRDGTVVDFDSALFKSLALRAMQIAPGGEQEVEAVGLQLPDLGGRRSKHLYRRLEDEEIETELKGTVLAAVYELVIDERSHRIWVDPSGIILRGHFERPGGDVDFELVRLKTQPGAWPP
jgi:hypothetical protein